MNLRSVFAAIPLALALAAAAHAAESPLNALFACQEIPDNAARLTCLDREVTALRGESKRQEVIAVDREQLEKDSYGLQSSSKHGRIEGLEKLSVARFSKTPYGKLVVELQNGQVWAQSDTLQIFIPLGTPHEEMTVSIRNAALGSHQMQLNGDGPWFRVYREN